MKRSPLKRKTQLARSPMKKRRRKPREGDDPAHLAWVRTLPCVVSLGCGGVVQAHHSTAGRGLSQKAPDWESMPLCAKHHREFHDARGYFGGWDKRWRRDWQRSQVAYVQALRETKEAG